MRMCTHRNELECLYEGQEPYFCDAVAGSCSTSCVSPLYSLDQDALIVVVHNYNAIISCCRVHVSSVHAEGHPAA